jgi:tetratricopeptide (TPR) repeat protein
VKKALLIVLSAASLLYLPRASGAQSAATTLYRQANQVYQEGDYGSAIELYLQILESGVSHGSVYYNLGNAYFKDNQLGRAILFYERARRLLPRDEDVAANLALANELTVDKIAAGRGPLLTRALTWPAQSLSIAELTWITFTLYMLVATLAVVALSIGKNRFRKKLLATILVVGVFFVASGASLFGNIYGQRKISTAIVLTPSVDARSGPGQEYTKIFSVHEGTRIRIRQERENWYLISLPNGLAGWVPSEIAEII